jgi:UrcA family protein
MINKLLRSAAGFVIAATATIVTIAGSAAPVAAAPVETISIAIPTSGIDLASPAGVAHVKAEIRRSARLVCGPADRSVAAHQQRQQCIQTVVTAAMPRLDAMAAAAREARTDLAETRAPTTVVRR